MYAIKPSGYQNISPVNILQIYFGSMNYSALWTIVSKLLVLADATVKFIPGQPLSYNI